MTTPSGSGGPLPARQPASSAAGSWLDLLLAGASAGELHAHRTRLLDDVASAGHAQTHELAGKALKLQAMLEEKRRHSEELTVLNDLVRRLSTLRDTNGVLQEVTSQSRRLLAVDVAYIMLARDDGVLRIEVVDGSIGSTLRGIELAPGRGLGGQVIASGRAMAVEDYLADPHVSHVAEVDQVASDERLGGILGVPLQLGEKTIGVLLAADRTNRRFTDREVTLLASLASHAAIAIHNAAVFDQLSQAATTLEENNRDLRRSSELSQAAVELYHRLTRSLVSGASLAEVVAQLAEVLDARVDVLDGHDQPLATFCGAAQADLGASDPRECLLAVLAGRNEQQHLAGAGTVHGVQGSANVLVVPVTLKDGFAGCVVAQRVRPFDEGAVVLVESGAGAIGMAMASERSVVEAERRARGELMTVLLARDVDRAVVRRRARAAGADLDAVHAVVVVAGTDSATPELVRQASHEMATALGAWEAEHGGRNVLLVCDHSVQVVVDRVRAIVRDLARKNAAHAAHDGPPCLVGVSECEGGPAGVREGYEEAQRTVDVLVALGRPGAVALAGEIGIYGTLFSKGGRRDAARFVEQTLAPLLEHDRRHGRDLTGTLGSYLAHAQHHAQTCADLHIHPNTLYARLERITELLGEGWRAGDRALHLQLAVQLQRLAARLDD